MTHEQRFQQRRQTFAQQEQAAQRQYNQLSMGRLVWFIGFAGLIGLSIRHDWTPAAIILTIVGAAGFLRLLVWHQAIRRQRDFAHHLALINDDETGRLTRTYTRPETGQEFADPAHPYTGDLDVFGKHSLFRLLNRTHTFDGQRRLADWLRKPAPPAVIRERQAAVADLRDALDWRQELEATACLSDKKGQSPEKLLGWATGAAVPLPAWLNIVRWLLPALTATLLLAWLTGYVPGAVVWLALFSHALVLSRTARPAQVVSDQTYDMVQALGVYRDLFRYAESRPFTAPALLRIQQTLLSTQQPASVAIGQLSHLSERLSFRKNPYFFLLFGLLSLWDVQYLLRLERWRQQHGPAVGRWIDALAELEALSSLAGFAYAHPGYAVPNLLDVPLRIQAEGAAHPLINPAKAVANSLTLDGIGRTVLITGSNMSGKSTFLRTLGTNIVLALAGSVVSAHRFALSPVQVFTSMRTQDSLEESTSSFYAELKRLQTLLHLTGPDATDVPVLYFLDEILKGTNSADRHRGAEALIHQLHRTPASGFVSTHDIELGQLGDSVDYVVNYHFQSDIRAGELLFDYRLREGVCESFNASQLMQAIGIAMPQPTNS